MALAISFKLYYNEILLKNVTANGIKTDFSAEIADEGGSRVEPLVYMTPKQPFFVTASESYVKYIMNRFGIVHFYQCRTGKEPRYAVPDGCVDMVFCCNPSRPSADICGTVLSPQAVLLESDSCYFGVRFLPGYNPILGTAHAVHDLVNQRVPFSALIQDERMFENICATTDFRKQISAFMHSYMKIYRRVSPMENSNLLVLHSANQLFRTAGRVSIESLAEETGYTPRYLDRSFREETGLSPKQLAKIVRFQTAVSALNAPNGRNLTEIAMDLGYYDQSHFVHDFKAFTGLTPKKYEALLRADAYDQKLQILPANIPLFG
ncbi:helix-turn-helix domain-containing protein [uncultured Ruminococcus sp.]|uniref:helix-turn-helix domain-containing protein n=1 Tax=uncultured Ruminococcus sp. TaxID=165186 RepID=UPI0025E6C94E|nr:helix-turn-helix domain-containing protein [uncultured Ruminococcus sp.]